MKVPKRGLPPIIRSAVNLVLVLQFPRVAQSDVRMRTDHLPSRYWRFENSTHVSSDSQNRYDLRLPVNNERAIWRSQTDGGVVGGWMYWNGSLINKTKGPAGWDATAGPIPLDVTGSASCPGVTIEFLVKPGLCFMRGGRWLALRGAGQLLEFGGTDITWRSHTVFSPEHPGPNAEDTLTVTLNGSGLLSTDYLFNASNDRWHHVVVQKSGSTGEQRLWIDGQSPPGWFSCGTFAENQIGNRYDGVVTPPSTL